SGEALLRTIAAQETQARGASGAGAQVADRGLRPVARWRAVCRRKVCGGVRGIRQLEVILALRERRSDGAAESGHTLCASSTNRSLSASPQKIPVDRYACFHRRMTDVRVS